jgi:hypothetical protein
MRRSPYPHPTHVVKPKDSRTRQEIRADLTLAEETDMLSTMLTPYDIKQQALEIALAYVDHLIDNEKSIDQAIDHATHRFGVARSELRDMYFRRTNSLRPRITVASTPSVAVSP